VDAAIAIVGAVRTKTLLMLVPRRMREVRKNLAPRRSILKRAPAPDVWVAPVLLAEVGKPSV
jgi:hypothetical protein